MTHDVVSVDTEIGGGRSRSRCSCGWGSGWRAARYAAVAAQVAHRVALSEMSAVRAAAILNDHAHGLHDDFDGPDQCSWICCSEAREVAARQSISK